MMFQAPPLMASPSPPRVISGQVSSYGRNVRARGSSSEVAGEAPIPVGGLARLRERAANELASAQAYADANARDNRPPPAGGRTQQVR
jgi:hypothetical protein